MTKIIDAHTHTNFEDEWMKEGAKESKVDYSQEGLKKEMAENNVAAVVSITIASSNKNVSTDFQTPLLIKCNTENAVNIAAINPYKAGKEEIKKTKELIKSGEIKGLKVYLGYFPFYPYDKVYHPFYNLAAKYNIPVIFHTGDTYSEKAKVKFAHPLNVDEVAVDFPNTKFVIAHLGNPWVIDAAEVIYKNKNVYGDLSGFAVGDASKVLGISIDSLKEALNYCGYSRIMYGSDWPIAPMKPYIALIKKIIPEESHNAVFYDNTKNLFNIK